jgi:serine/threonine protein kinase/Flp pilus assembly protein TadD
MKPERWQQLDQLFHAALERGSGERVAFLAEACAGDDSMRKQVEALLAAHEEAGSFIESPAMEVEARGVAGDSENQAAGMANGETVSHYRIIAPLGSGGMGDVYLAQDTVLSRQVALKLLPEHFTRDRDRLRRFQQEARAASALNHPNIITIYEIGQVDGRHFIATEFIDGQTLRLRISGSHPHTTGPRGHTSGKPLWLREVLDVVIQTCDALAAAHEAGIVHRDIKPENIMVRRRDGYVKVLDFGLAKLTDVAVDSEAPTMAEVKTSAGAVMGTASYMSPEQARGEQVDARTDIWSFGVVLYELVAGCVPFERSTPSEVIALILEREPPPLARYARDIPERLEEIVGKALTKNREERYQSAKDLLVDLKRLKRQLEVQAEIERREEPEIGAGPRAATDSGQTASVTPPESPRAGQRTSSAGYFVTEIQRHKKAFVIISSVMLAVLVAALILLYGRIYRRPSQPLTEKDTILLADFVNKTGDEVFDGALKQGLAVQLEQSPFLNIVPDERVQQALQSMRRLPDVRLTRDVALEICERQGLKAMIAGSIVVLGSHYVIEIEAINAHTLETLAHEQEEAASKEQVLSVLRELATRLREKLGESLSTIQKFDAPIEATTSSLEALKAYSDGAALHLKGKEPEAIPVLKGAVELDPQFAMAYGVLAAACDNSGETKAAREYYTKAFELRERASQREKLWIMTQYYAKVTGELENAIGAAELLKQIYPRFPFSRFRLGYLYDLLGQYEKAVSELQEAVRLDPNWPISHRRLAICLRHQGRFAEAKEVLNQAAARKIDVPGLPLELYYLAFLQGDTGEMHRQMEGLRSNPAGLLSFLGLQAATAEVAGQFRRARESRTEQVEVLLKRDRKDAAAGQEAGTAESAALYGHCEMARQAAANSLAIARTPASLNSAALALGLCGEIGQAQSLAEEYGKLVPRDTLANAIDLPLIRAAIANHHQNYTLAIESLKESQRYDRTDSTIFADIIVTARWIGLMHYIRGQAFLGQHSSAEAAAEFRYILDNRRIDPLSLLQPLAQLGLAQAIALQGDHERARKAYEDFFSLWKDADPDLPILVSARKEYQNLK